MGIAKYVRQYKHPHHCEFSILPGVQDSMDMDAFLRRLADNVAHFIRLGYTMNDYFLLGGDRARCVLDMAAAAGIRRNRWQNLIDLALAEWEMQAKPYWEPHKL